MTLHWPTIGIWILRLLAAAIMLQTLYFKFSAAEESVYIFSTLGMEPWGRIGTGVFELIASLLILIPATTAFGVLLAIGLMGVAIFFHVTKLGISVKEDGGQLFLYACLVLLASVVLLVLFRQQLFNLIHKILRK